MKSIGIAKGLSSLIAPVRPIGKSRYPLVPMCQYVRWTDAQNLSFDPWIRVHSRTGGRLLNICPRSMRITGPIADWEEWSGMRLSETGPYVVPGALVPVQLDVEHDLGVYEEPNVWMVHDLSG